MKWDYMEAEKTRKRRWITLWMKMQKDGGKGGQEAPSKGRTWNKKSHDTRNLSVKCVDVLRPQGICSNQGSGASGESLRTILQRASLFTLSLPAYHVARNKLICYCTEHPVST